MKSTGKCRVREECGKIKKENYLVNKVFGNYPPKQYLSIILFFYISTLLSISFSKCFGVRQMKNSKKCNI